MQNNQETEKMLGGWLLLTNGDIEISQAGDDLEIIALTPEQVTALRALLGRSQPAPAWGGMVQEGKAAYGKAAYGKAACRLPRPFWPATGSPSPSHIIGTCPHCGGPVVRGSYYRTRRQGGGLLRVQECWAALQDPPACTYRQPEQDPS